MLLAPAARRASCRASGPASRRHRHDRQPSASTQQHAAHQRQGQDPQAVRSSHSSVAGAPSGGLVPQVGPSSSQDPCALARWSHFSIRQVTLLCRVNPADLVSPTARPQPATPAQPVPGHPLVGQLPSWPHLQPRGVVCLEDGQHPIVTVGTAAKHPVCRNRHLRAQQQRRQPAGTSRAGLHTHC